MRVLILHDCAGVMLQLSQELNKRGHEAELYFFRDDPYLQYGKTRFRGSKLQTVKHVFSKILENYDIVHLYNTMFPNHPLPYDYILARLRRQKTVIHFHGSDLRIGHNNPAVRFLLHNKTLLVSTPDLLAFAPKRAIWLPNPVDTDKFYPVPVEPHNSIRILHSNTWSWRFKGTDHIIRSVKELKKKGYEIELEIIGKDNPVPFVSMPALYSWCDIVINEVNVPVHSLVGIEAMMSGRPVLSSYKVPREISNPPIIDIDPETLTEKLEWLIQEPEIRQDLGEKGSHWARETHSLKNVADKLLTVYERIK